MKFRYSIHTLKNGMQVVLAPTNKINSVTVQATIKAGTVYENPQDNGITHFLEHVSLIGTKSHPDKFELSEFLDQNGADSNGSTSAEQLRYYIEIPYTKIDLGLDFIYEVLYAPSFNESYINLERSIILDEISKNENNIYTKAARYFNEIILGTNNPYYYEILGPAENVRNFSLDFIEANYKKIHNPNRVILSVVGKFDENKVLKEIKKLYEPMKSTTFTSKFEDCPIQTSKTGVKYDKKSDLVICDIYFKLPRTSEFDYKEKILIGEICNILAGPLCSRLKKRLREKEGILYSIFTGITDAYTHGMLYIAFEVPPALFKKTLNIVFEELNILVKEGIDEKELNRYKDFVRNREILYYDKIHSTVGRLLIYPLFYKTRDIMSYEKLTKIFYDTTPEAMSKLSSKYIKLNEASVLGYGNVNKSTHDIIKEVVNKYR